MISAEQMDIVNALARLCACAIKGTKPDPVWAASLDTEALYNLAKKHHLTCITACALESAGVSTPEFKTSKGKAIAGVARMDIDRISLCAMMDAAGIRYMPLKGSIIKTLYPEIGMREMSDNDILIDSERAGEVRGFMESLGFETVEFDHEVRDVYHKKPVSSFELHRKLFEDGYGVIAEYYENVWNRLIKDEGNGSGYHFTTEDFYLFMLAHEYKHYSYAGTGLRSLLDVYVYLRKYGEVMDREYLDRELRKIELYEFEKTSAGLAFHFFDREPVSAEEAEMLEDMLHSGTYGTAENLFRMQMKGQSKAAYLFRQVFPPVDWMRKSVGFVDKCVLLYPVGVVWRWIRTLFFRKNRVKPFVTAVKNKDK